MTSGKMIGRYADMGRAYRRWYKHARLVIGLIARWTGQDIGRVADVVAITSPRLSVNRNLRVSYNYLRGLGLPSDIIRSTRTALRHYELSGEIRGPKTSAFAKALRGADNVCVVDTHIASAFGYRPMDARSKYVREHVAQVIGRIARRRHWTLSEAQAAVWAGYYRTAYPTGNVPIYRPEFAVPF